MFSLTVVMYHYVRPLQRTRFPSIKGVDLKLFREQVAFFKKAYHPITMKEFLGWKSGEHTLPDNALLITFDDGYADHYQYAFPILHDAGIQGSFYIPKTSLLDGTVLDVNKIHFVLASTDQYLSIVALIDNFILEKDSTIDIAALHALYYIPNRWDPPEVNYIKRVLQHALHETLRADIIDIIFKKYVTADTAAFAEELYLNVDQAKLMLSCGMHIGGHGDKHVWLNKLDKDEQKIEIEQSLAMLKHLNIAPEEHTFCYPYGGNNALTHDILHDYGFQTAFTVEPRKCVQGDHNYLVPRLDINDIQIR